MTVGELRRSILKNYFSFNGRLNRKPFFMQVMMLAAMSIFLILYIITVEPSLKADPVNFGTNVRRYVIFWVVYIPLIISGISLGVRRLHDMNLSGWWMLLSIGSFFGGTDYGSASVNLMVTILGIIAQMFSIVLLLRRGTRGPNRFGEDPIPAPVKKKKTKAERKAEAQARKEAAEAERRANEELERSIAEAHPDYDEYDMYDAMQEAKAKRDAEKKAAEAAAKAAEDGVNTENNGKNAKAEKAADNGKNAVNAENETKADADKNEIKKEYSASFNAELKITYPGNDKKDETK